MDFNLAKYTLSKSYTNCAIFEKDQQKHTALLQKLTNIAPTAFLAQLAHKCATFQILNSQTQHQDGRRCS